MGSFVTIGFVDLYNKKQFVKHCADILEKYKEHILDVSYKYPTDDDGYQWEEKTIPFPFIFKEAIEKCIQNELVEIKINWTFLPRTDFFSYMHVESLLQDSLCLHISIPEKAIKVIGDLESIEQFICDLLQQAIETGFCYAFCDNEVHLEKKLSDVMASANPFSIFVANNGNHPKIQYAPWMIDGLTSRTPKK